MTDFKLTIRDLSLRAVLVPLARPLVTRVVTLESASLLLIDLLTEEGITGRAYLFGSLLRPGRFHAASDVDVAVECDDLEAETPFAAPSSASSPPRSTCAPSRERLPRRSGTAENRSMDEAHLV